MMEALTLYLFKSSLITAAFWGIYHCFFRNETFYRFNRYFLLAGVLSALVFPLYTYSYRVDILSSGSPAYSVPAEDTTVFLWSVVAAFLYAAGVCVLLIRRLNGLIVLKRVIRQSDSVSAGGCKLINTNAFKSSFSVFKYIFMNVGPHTSEAEQKMIFQHELAHVAQRHWVDLLAAQVLCIVQWFNPFVWLYLTAIRQNHEYLADEAVLKSGSSPALYRAALINQSLGTPAISFVSSFSQVDRLKRINMMRKPASASVRKWLVVLILPVLLLLFQAFAKPEINLVSPDIHTGHRSAKSAGMEEPAVKMKIARAERSSSSTAIDSAHPIIFLDGKEIKSMDNLPRQDIESIDVLKGKSAVAAYGERGKDGVIIITSKRPD